MSRQQIITATGQNPGQNHGQNHGLASTDIYSKNYRSAETNLIRTLSKTVRQYEWKKVSSLAHALDRESGEENTLAGKLLRTFSLDTKEGVAIMQLAECLLRIPEAKKQEAIIRQSLRSGEWDLLQRHGVLDTLTTMALDTTKKFSDMDSLVTKMGWPVIRPIVRAIVKVMGNTFVLGKDVESASRNSKRYSSRYSFSYDMLAEAATNWEDAENYYRKYLSAAKSFSCISVKISGINPRFTPHETDLLMKDTLPRLKELSRLCDGTMYIDAEESERLDATLQVFAALLAQTDGDYKLGIAIQAYQKRCLGVVKYLDKLSRHYKKKICVRLVKGAYWDMEIKNAQQQGLEYPIWTSKNHSDIAFIVCAEQLFKAPYIYPAFATHNPVSVAYVLHISEHITESSAQRINATNQANKPKQRGEQHNNFEFQRLFGMGEGLHDALIKRGYHSRIYAPVGDHENLLAYLVRRLLENGANSSFIHSRKIVNPLQDITTSVPRAADIYLPRINSIGTDLSDARVRAELLKTTAPKIAKTPASKTLSVNALREACRTANKQFLPWSQTAVAERAAMAEKFSNILEERRYSLAQLISAVGKRTYEDGLNEIREAVDFCRYYALQAQDMFSENHNRTYTGESSVTNYRPRGPWLVIAPWNFPVAITVGPIVAALVSGCPVIAKSAPQTKEIGELLGNWLQECFPPGVVTMLCPNNKDAEKLVTNEYIKGITFTGSHPTAARLRTLLAGDSARALIPLVAETGGVNLAVCDSSALPEQLIHDLVIGAFNSAGQRCSATRLVCVPRSKGKFYQDMISQTVRGLQCGDNRKFFVDSGPVIDAAAYKKLSKYISKAARDGRVLAQGQIIDKTQLLIPPTLIKVNEASECLTEEYFGPILHFCQYKDIEELTTAINSSAMGLTLSIHSRDNNWARKLAAEAEVGNVYINRDQVGAVVESHPFGGCNLSGTGPKAGGKDYLLQFVWEQCIVENTTAMGGNFSLLSGSDR